jgi:hypothetical protein
MSGRHLQPFEYLHGSHMWLVLSSGGDIEAVTSWTLCGSVSVHIDSWWRPCLWATLCWPHVRQFPDSWSPSPMYMILQLLGRCGYAQLFSGYYVEVGGVLGSRPTKHLCSLGCFSSRGVVIGKGPGILHLWADGIFSHSNIYMGVTCDLFSQVVVISRLLPHETCTGVSLCISIAGGGRGSGQTCLGHRLDNFPILGRRHQCTWSCNYWGGVGMLSYFLATMLRSEEYLEVARRSIYALWDVCRIVAGNCRWDRTQRQAGTPKAFYSIVHIVDSS